jgi:hypothetical protein
MPDKNATAANGFVNEWVTGMFSAPCKSPQCCLVNCVLPCIFARTHRLALIGDIKNYTCCAGIFGQFITGKLNGCTSKCPAACLCCEACCCPSLAASGNRACPHTQSSLLQ